SAGPTSSRRKPRNTNCSRPPRNRCRHGPSELPARHPAVQVERPVGLRRPARRPRQGAVRQRPPREHRGGREGCPGRRGRLRAAQPPADREKAGPRPAREAQAPYDLALRNYLTATEKYARHSDTVKRPDVPDGSLTKYQWKTSKVFPGTERDYWVYVPAQYKP